MTNSNSENIHTAIINTKTLVDDLTNQLTNINTKLINNQNDSSLNEQKTKLTQDIESTSDKLKSLVMLFENIQSTKILQSNMNTINGIINTDTIQNNELLTEFEEQNANKIKLIEINNYYSEQYFDRTNIMKSIILVCLPLIILLILKNKGILNNIIFSILFIIIVVVGIIYLFKLILLAISHNNMRYQQYDWNFNTSTAPVVDTSGTVNIISNSSEPPVPAGCPT